jgi:hypothetical protein
LKQFSEPCVAYTVRCVLVNWNSSTRRVRIGWNSSVSSDRLNLYTKVLISLNNAINSDRLKQRNVFWLVKQWAEFWLLIKYVMRSDRLKQCNEPWSLAGKRKVMYVLRCLFWEEEASKQEDKKNEFSNNWIKILH